MSKKHLMAAIATCVLCLGIGAFIGAGIIQNGLAATGANGEDSFASRQAADYDFAAMELADLEKAYRNYTEKLWIMKERQETAREALAEILENADKFSGETMTDRLYRKLYIIYKAREENEEFRLELCGLDKIRTYRPGANVDCSIWEYTAERLEKVLAMFDEAAAYYETVRKDIIKTLWDKRA